MFILDTNVVSELRRRTKADRKVAAWAKVIPLSQMFLSVITILELEKGTLLMERKDVRQGQQLRTWLDDQVMARFDGRILSIHCRARRPEPDRAGRNCADSGRI